MLIASTRPWLVFFMEGPVIVERSFHAHGESSRTVDFSSVGSLDDALRLVGGKKDAARLATKKMKDSAVFLFKSGRHAGLRRHPGTHLFVALDFIIPTFPAIGSPMLIDAEVAPQFRHYSLERRRNATTAMYDVIFGTNIKDSPGRIGGDSAGKPMLVSHDFRHCVGGECWHLAWSELEVKCSGASRPHGCTLLQFILLHARCYLILIFIALSHYLGFIIYLQPVFVFFRSKSTHGPTDFLYTILHRGAEYLFR